MAWTLQLLSQSQQPHRRVDAAPCGAPFCLLTLHKAGCLLPGCWPLRRQPGEPGLSLETLLPAAPPPVLSLDRVPSPGVGGEDPFWFSTERIENYSRLSSEGGLGRNVTALSGPLFLNSLMECESFKSCENHTFPQTLGFAL